MAFLYGTRNFDTKHTPIQVKVLSFLSFPETISVKDFIYKCCELLFYYFPQLFEMTKDTKQNVAYKFHITKMITNTKSRQGTLLLLQCVKKRCLEVSIFVFDSTRCFGLFSPSDFH